MTRAVPLLGFANGARKLPFSLLGLLQFLAPTGQFLVGAFIYDEPLPPASLAADVTTSLPDFFSARSIVSSALTRLAIAQPC